MAQKFWPSATLTLIVVYPKPASHIVRGSSRLPGNFWDWFHASFRFSGPLGHGFFGENTKYRLWGTKPLSCALLFWPSKETGGRFTYTRHPCSLVTDFSGRTPNLVCGVPGLCLELFYSGPAKKLKADSHTLGTLASVLLASLYQSVFCLYLQWRNRCLSLL